MLSTVDRVNIINLLERRDRREEMRAELASVGVVAAPANADFLGWLPQPHATAHGWTPRGIAWIQSTRCPLPIAHCMDYTASAIAALVPYLEAMLQRPAGDPHGGPMHVDGAYNWFRAAYPQMSTWIAHPQIASQRSSRTDVHALRWFDRTPGVRALTALARRVRNRLAG